MGEFDYAIKILEGKQEYYSSKLESALEDDNKNWHLIRICEDRLLDLDRAITTLIREQFI